MLQILRKKLQKNQSINRTKRTICNIQTWEIMREDAIELKHKDDPVK